MEKMTVAQAIGRMLKKIGTERYYLYNGHANWGMLDAFEFDAGIQGIRTRHECHAIHMADGEWRARRSLPLPVTCTTTGPGNYNTVAAVSEAYFDSSAILCIMCGGPTKWYERGGLQEHYRRGAEQFIRIIEPVTKKAVHVIRPDAAIQQLVSCYKSAITGRPGPVAYYVPMDVLNTTIEIDLPDIQDWIKVTPPGPSPEGLKKAVELIRGSKRPFCFVATGVNNARAWAELREFAEKLQIPVACSIGAKGALPEDHPMSLGVCDRAGSGHAAYAAANSDLVIGIGTHFNDLNTAGWTFYDIPAKQKLIHIDIDETELGRVYQTEVPIVSDAKLGLRGLIDAWEKSGYKRQGVDAWLKAVDTERKQWEKEEKNPLATSDIQPLHYARIVSDISDAINEFDPQTAVVFDTGNVMNFMSAFLKLTHPNFQTCNQQFCQMGYSLPAAIGARIARPEHPVVAITGDQSFMMTGLSMATATEYGLKGIVAVVLNNRTIQAEIEGARAKFGRSVGDFYRIEETGELWNPDIQMIGKAMRLEVIKVTKPEELKPALKKALESGKVCLIDVDTDHMQPRYSVPLIKKLGTMPFPYTWTQGSGVV
jgi:acetolactate synthase-1/2/3 large subunit